MASEHPQFAETAATPPDNDKKNSKQKRPDDCPHLPGIEQRWAARWVEMEADRLAARFAEDWRRYARPRPRRSQWAQLRLMARAARDPEEFSKHFETFASSGAASWKWKGTAPGQNSEQTLALTICNAWENLKKSRPDKSDPRADSEANRARAFLAAVAEAARRLRDQ
jgi:hypothetical protein